MTELRKRIEELALELTHIKSVVETPGEKVVAQRIYDILSDLPYFSERPQQLRKVFVPDDSLERFSVLALVRGQKESSSETVVGLGHFDTVGTSDYGRLEEYATQPFELTRKLKEVSLTEDAEEDLKSGNYLFARGIFDMKTGVATLMAILERLAADPESFSGNLMLALVCDEESNSKGMLSVVPELVRLKEEENLNYLTLLDTDYMTELYPGDHSKYIYAGAVGKLMPSFYIVGKETHVGEAFKGLDANQISAEIVRNVNLNPLYSDEVDGEVTVPPVTLKMRDMKTEYSVQTSRNATLFFNYTTTSSTPGEVMLKMKAAARVSFENVLETLNQHYEEYCDMSAQPFEELPFEPRVMSYLELASEVEKEKGAGFREEFELWIRNLDNRADLDERDKTLAIVDHLHELWSDREPVIIVYFTPPYYPHIHVTEEDEAGRRLLETVADVIAENQDGDPLVLKKFFPYISDLSFGGAPRDEQTMAELKGNLPGFGLTYELPIEDMQELDLKGLNIGPFGKDAHKFTERIEVNYSLNIAPKLVWDTIMKLLDNELDLKALESDSADDGAGDEAGITSQHM